MQLLEEVHNISILNLSFDYTIVYNDLFKQFANEIRKIYGNKYHSVRFWALVREVGSEIKKFCKRNGIDLTINEFIKYFKEILFEIDPYGKVFTKNGFREIKEEVIEVFKLVLFDEKLWSRS